MAIEVAVLATVPWLPLPVPAAVPLLVLASLSLWLRDSMRTFWASFCLVNIYYVAVLLVWRWIDPDPGWFHVELQRSKLG